jgi:hypothetical protein
MSLSFVVAMHGGILETCSRKPSILLMELNIYQNNPKDQQPIERALLPLILTAESPIVIRSFELAIGRQREGRLAWCLEEGV